MGVPTHHRGAFILASRVIESGAVFVVFSYGNHFTCVGLRDGAEINGTYSVHDTLRRAMNFLRRI